MREEAPSDEKDTSKCNQVGKEVLSWQIEGEEYIGNDEQYDGGNGNQACNSSLFHHCVPPMFGFRFSMYFLTLSSVIVPTLP